MTRQAMTETETTVLTLGRPPHLPEFVRDIGYSATEQLDQWASLARQLLELADSQVNADRAAARARELVRETYDDIARHGVHAG
jgi:hypothetical protein